MELPQNTIALGLVEIGVAAYGGVQQNYIK